MGERQKDANWNPRMRDQGNPHARADTRKATGRANVMPAQGKSVPSPRYFGARYRLGAPIRPSSISFDNGFLDKFKPRQPKAADLAALVKWRLKLEVAEGARPDLEEACAAYRHFLEGAGRPRLFSYESYVYTDNSGVTTLANAMLDIQDGAEIIWEADKSVKTFSLTGGQISCGSNELFPYPETENWQKAIGGHVIWLSGNAQIIDKGGETWFRLTWCSMPSTATTSIRTTQTLSPVFPTMTMACSRSPGSPSNMPRPRNFRRIASSGNMEPSGRGMHWTVTTPLR